MSGSDPPDTDSPPPDRNEPKSEAIKSPQDAEFLEGQTVTGSETRMNVSRRNAFALAIIGLVGAGIVGIWGQWAGLAIIAIVPLAAYARSNCYFRQK